jgi:hypothetical protein
MRDGERVVIEYSEMTEKGKEGYRLGNIGFQLYRIE